MATVDKNFRIKNGLIVQGTTGTINGQNILTETGSDSYIINLIGGQATSTNTINAVVKRDGSGNFSAGTITANLIGNVTGNVSGSAGTVTSLSGHTSDELSEGSTNKFFTDERAQDAVGNILGSGFTYNDPANTITLDSTVVQLRVANVSDTEIGYLDGVTSAIQTQLDAKLAKAGGTMSGAIAMGNNKITGLGTPTADTDAATKAYVDSAAQGIDWKASVRAATTAAVTLSSGLANGSVIDGVTLATGDRILVKNQTLGSENGIYVVNASGAPTRATDADTAAEVTASLAIFVEEGTSQADSGWTLTNNGAVTIGTTALTFTQFTGLGQITAGTGLTKSGNTISVDTTTIQARVANVSDTEIGYLDGVTSAIQTQLDAKAPLNSPTFTGTVVLPTGTVTSGMILDGTIVNADINASAAIAYSKLNLTGSITSSDIVDGTIATADIADSAITSAKIADGTIVNADINASAAIALSKLATDPLARANHTGTQAASTISDFNTAALSATASAYDAAGAASTAQSNAYNADAAILNGTTAFTAVNINSISTIKAATSTISSAGTANAITWAGTDYKTAKVLVKFATATHSQISEVLLTLDSSNNIAITEYANVGTNGDLGTTTASYSGGNVSVSVTTLQAATTVSVVATLIK
jgi:hypothetical protein